MDFTISWVINSTPLYKIIALRWFRKMVEERRNTLLRPSSWDDPYEMNYSNSVIATEQGDIPLDASHWFGQCWSLCEESITMWQSFKKSEEPFVKIKVDAHNLIMGLKERDDELRIGVLDYVRYFKPQVSDYREKINDIVQAHRWPDNFINRGITLAELYPVYGLLTKRDIFEHEKEVRLLLLDMSTPTTQKSVSYSFDTATINEIVIDPWTSKDDTIIKEIECELRLSFPKESTVIRKSSVFSDSSQYFTRYVI